MLDVKDIIYKVQMWAFQMLQVSVSEVIKPLNFDDDDLVKGTADNDGDVTIKQEPADAADSDDEDDGNGNWSDYSAVKEEDLPGAQSDEGMG